MIFIMRGFDPAFVRFIHVLWFSHLWLFSKIHEGYDFFIIESLDQVTGKQDYLNNKEKIKKTKIIWTTSHMTVKNINSKSSSHWFDGKGALYLFISEPHIGVFGLEKVYHSLSFPNSKSPNDKFYTSVLDPKI